MARSDVFGALLRHYGAQTSLQGWTVTEENLLDAYNAGYVLGWQDAEFPEARYNGAPAMQEAMRLGYADGRRELERTCP